MVASGNTMFWRVSYDATTIECRKAQPELGGFEHASNTHGPKWGELYHQHDKQRGGFDAGW